MNTKDKIFEELESITNVQTLKQKTMEVYQIQKLISLGKRIIKLGRRSSPQFNFDPISWFDKIFNRYIEIIINRDTCGLFTIYLDIKANLADFKIQKISYEDSKNRETIAKYFLSLIKISLKELFIEFPKLPLLETFQENEKWMSLESIQKMEESKEDNSITKPIEISANDLKSKTYKFEEGNKKYLRLRIENMLTNPIEYVNDDYWSGYFTKMENQINFLKEFRDSFLYKITFSMDDQSFISRQFLASHMKRLFNWTLKNVHENFLYEAKQTVAKIYFNRSTLLNKTQKKEFEIILQSMSVQDAFRIEGILNDNICDILKNTYFANLPNNLSGLTIFGGTILLQQSLAEKNEFKSCYRKIAFIHEAARAMRKCKDGSYNPMNKTLKSNLSLNVGMPGSGSSLNDLNSQNEGERIIENWIFGVFFTKINKVQIEFLNRSHSWDLNQIWFRTELAMLGKQVSQQYELARRSHYISGIRCNDCEHY